MLTCATCGSEEPDGARFCGSCGAPFASDDPPPAHDTSMEASTPTTEVVPPSGWPEVSPSDPLTPSVSLPDDAGVAHVSMQPFTSTEVPASARTAASAGVTPPPAWPEVQVPDPVPHAPASTAPSADLRRRVSLPVLIAVLALLIAGGAIAALFATGVIGPDSGKSESTFVKQVNENVLSPLGQVDETAAGNASTAEGAFTRTADGSRIVRVADEAFAYLRALSGLSAQQKGEVQLLLAFVAANRGYGQAFAAFTPNDSEGEVALDSAAAAVRSAIATLESRLSTGLRLPAQAAIITLRSSPSTAPSSTTNTTPPAPNLTAVYVRQVDGLLNQSHAVVLALRSFVARAASDAINRSAAVTLARSYVEQRRLELEQAKALTVPPAFASAQRLLVLSLEASLVDDQALVAWTAARRDGSVDARAAFDRANRLGTQATALKRQFLGVYGPRRQAATGLSPASLPDDF